MTRAMTDCAEEGQLRAFLDAELVADEQAALAAHLDGCATCAARLATLEAYAGAVSPLLAGWLPAQVATSAAATAPSEEQRARMALARFQILVDTAASDAVAPQGWYDQAKERVQMMFGRFGSPRLRPVFGAVALAAILGLVLTLSPVGSLADQLSKTFRVQQFSAITVHVPAMTGMPQMQQMDQITPQQLAQFQALLAPLGTPTTNATHETVRQVADQAAARAFLTGQGSKLYAPGTIPSAYSGMVARYGVADPTSSTYVLNAQTAQQYIAFANSPELSALPWPAGVDQLTFGLDTPAAAMTVYGDEATKQGFGILQMAVLNGDTSAAGPALKLPDELDVNAFRAALLALPGLPADTVAQLKAVKDWERTLIIPVPEDATTKNVSIKGNAGILIVDAQGRGSLVIWQQGGMMFAVGGTLSEVDVMAVANGLTQVP